MIPVQQEKNDYSSSDDEDYLMTARQNLLPPNQIITKKYQPDVNPLMKLVPVKASQKSLQTTSQQEQQTNPDKNMYKFDFEEQDSLGYHYAEKIKTNLLYIKFDNRSFFQCPQNKFKYLAGLFVPLNDLLKPELKINKSLYKLLSSDKHYFPFLQYENKIEDSFKQNCLSKDLQIKFSSNYQSSNLFMAIKTGHFQYDLILQNDINSKGTTQWFNFAVQLFETGVFKFNIVNLSKTRSLFQKGMKVPYFSYQNNLATNATWSKGGQNITYERNLMSREGRNYQNSYHTLHFQYENQHKQDIVVFSYCFPYTGLDMQRFFGKITQKKLSINLRIQRQKICQTLTGLPVYVYHIYPRKNISSLHNLHRGHLSLLQSTAHKSVQTCKGIAFLARQHPGQSQSSFILQGIIDFLLQNNEYDNSKKNFHYFIFPILNADGVYYGNYRTNLSGNDLNRMWKNPRKDFHPEVYFTKKYLHNVNKSIELKLIVDIHGHSSALNSFFYGNPSRRQGGFQIENPRLFPYYCSKQMKQISFMQSTFIISQDKKSSARIVLNQMFPKASVYTLQNSFLGYRKGKKVVEYTIQRYKKLGRNLISCFLQFTKITERVPLIKQKWQKQIEMVYSLNPNKKNIASQLQNNPSQSDSEAEKQLIQFDQEYQKIDQYNNLLNEKSTYLGKTQFPDQAGLQGLDTRFFNRKRSKYQRNGVQGDAKKNNTVVGSKGAGYFHQDNVSFSQLGLAAHQGFLSILKIETKKSPLSQQGQISQQKCTNGLLSDQQDDEQKQNPSKQVSSNYRTMKTAINSPVKQKYFKKQYTVHSLKQNQNMIRNERRYINLLNEKDYLLRRRKSTNKIGEVDSQLERQRLLEAVHTVNLNQQISKKQTINFRNLNKHILVRQKVMMKTFGGDSNFRSNQNQSTSPNSLNVDLNLKREDKHMNLGGHYYNF